MKNLPNKSEELRNAELVLITVWAEIRAERYSLKHEINTKAQIVDARERILALRKCLGELKKRVKTLKKRKR